MLARMREGFAIVLADRRLAATMVVTVIYNVFAWPFTSMIPVIGRDSLLLGAKGVGLLASVEGIGAFTGAVLLALWLRPGWHAAGYVGGVAAYLVSVIAFALAPGALLGGTLADRLGRLRTVGAALVLLAGTIFALAAIGPGRDTEAMILLGVLYFEIGIFTASSYALFMDLTDPRLGATEFSSFMAATNACEAWAAFAVGKLAASLGYAPAFRTMALLSLLALPLLIALARARRKGVGELPEAGAGEADGPT